MNNKPNNTDQFVISPMGGRIPVKDIELVDEAQQIWKGKIVDFPNSSIEDPIAYFSRKYDREHNDLDKCIEEYKMPASVNGYEFWLIPKEKFLCSMMPQISDGGVLLPTTRKFPRRPQM